MENDTLTEAEKIWQEIKDLQLNLFSLSDQTVNKYFKFIKLNPTKAYLTVSASAAVPALDDLIGKEFDINQIGKYIVVNRKSK